MKPILTIAAAALLASGSLALAQTTPSGPSDTQGTKPMQQAPAGAEANADTSTFIKTVPGANMFEIESSKLALKKASAADVKKFARRMVKDHTEAGKAFKTALEKVETTSATKSSASPMDAKQQGMLDELKAASGKDFQAKYIQMQADAHRQAVALFSAYAKSGDHPALKEFAKATLPTLKMHEKMVQELQSAHG